MTQRLPRSAQGIRPRPHQGRQLLFPRHRGIPRHPGRHPLHDRGQHPSPGRTRHHRKPLRHRPRRRADRHRLRRRDSPSTRKTPSPRTGPCRIRINCEDPQNNFTPNCGRVVRGTNPPAAPASASTPTSAPVTTSPRTTIPRARSSSPSAEAGNAFSAS